MPRWACRLPHCAVPPPRGFRPMHTSTFPRPFAAATRRRLRSGNMVTELVMAYGAQALLVALALGLLGGVYLMMNRATLVSDINAIATGMASGFGATDNWTGITTKQVADSGLVPARVVEGDTLIVGGDDTLAHVYPGVAKQIGTTGTKHFILQIGDATAPLSSEDCQDVAGGEYRGLRGVQIEDAIAFNITFPGTVTPASGSEATTMTTAAAAGSVAIWTRTGRSDTAPLSDRNRGKLAEWCGVHTATGATVFLGFD